MLPWISVQRSMSHSATTTSSPRVVHIATISPVGAMMQLWPMRSHPSSAPAFATPTTQVPFW